MKILLLIFCAAIVATARGQTNAQHAAQQALATFPKLVTASNLQALGFQSTNELATLQIAEAFPVFRLQMDQLSAYRTNQDPSQLLLDTRSVLFPVTVTQQVRSSVIVRKEHDRWKAVSFGGPKLITALTQTRQAAASAAHVPLSEFFMVEAPALSLHFVGHRIGTDLTLTAIADYPDQQLTNGQALSARDMFKMLAPAARENIAFPK